MKNNARERLLVNSVILPLLLSAIFLPTRSAFSENGDDVMKGDGSPASPYLVENEAHLRAIEANRFACYKLTRDIQLTQPWTPLCSKEPFEGALDGAESTISALDVKAGAARGFFAQIGRGGRVRNLAINGRVQADADVQAAGGLAGVSSGVVSEVACRVEITIDSGVSSDAAVGGLVGRSEGVVAFSSFEGAIVDRRETSEVAAGAIVGEAGKVVAKALATLLTAHAGFAAQGGAKDSSEDNTLENIVKAIGFRPDVIEVDVQPGQNGDLVITHNAPKADSPTLKSVFQILLGEAPVGMENVELNVENALATRIQLDFKKDGLAEQALDEIADARFPLNRVIMAGDSRYETILAQADKIRAATKEGLEFWMNPDRIDTYDSLRSKSDQFLEKAKSLGLPTLVVNSYYGAITEDVAAWLEENGLHISIWTLNDDAAIRRNILRDVHNATSRLPKALEVRNACRDKGVYGNQFDDKNLKEIGAIKSQAN